MRVLIAVGGGGHFSPALAVIEQMPQDWEILLVGRKHTFEGDSALSLEYQTAKRLGLLFESITTGRFQRKFTKHTFISMAKMPVGFSQAKKILSQFKPDAILSFGGYVSVPVVLAAAAVRVPIVIHEQTLHAGLANKIASRFAKKICISWEESVKFFPKEKVVLTGNPLREEFLNDTKSATSSRSITDFLNELKERLTHGTQYTHDPLIYITGGSGGAHGINVLVKGCLQKLLEEFTVIHQTGDAKEFGDFERLSKAKADLPEAYRKFYLIEKFINPEEVLAIMSRADIVISRSGINTVTELLYLGKPCLLVPLPYGQRNEQLTNAEFVKKIGLGEVIDQLSTSPDDLYAKVSEMISNVEVYKKHKEEARKLIHTDAAKKIIEVVCSAYEKEKRTAA
jgi:UDP-N-acetylglucosamine--N-acetylmuramyl-(pentapeptide) pyrophosphoryl-undecaprenol N-acetylglucosamine transferase